MAEQFSPSKHRHIKRVDSPAAMSEALRWTDVDASFYTPTTLSENDKLMLEGWVMKKGLDGHILFDNNEETKPALFLKRLLKDRLDELSAIFPNLYTSVMIEKYLGVKSRFKNTMHQDDERISEPHLRPRILHTVIGPSTEYASRPYLPIFKGGLQLPPGAVVAHKKTGWDCLHRGAWHRRPDLGRGEVRIRLFADVSS